MCCFFVCRSNKRLYLTCTNFAETRVFLRSINCCLQGLDLRHLVLDEAHPAGIDFALQQIPGLAGRRVQRLAGETSFQRCAHHLFRTRQEIHVGVEVAHLVRQDFLVGAGAGGELAAHVDDDREVGEIDFEARRHAFVAGRGVGQHAPLHADRHARLGPRQSEHIAARGAITLQLGQAVEGIGIVDAVAVLAQREHRDALTDGVFAPRLERRARARGGQREQQGQRERERERDLHFEGGRLRRPGSRSR